ncbi:leucine-rich repeat domain-containing protein [Hahella sp. NBU794]|uniref:leucine-rich repeat domain-containing protein n=1 Tax=Hahella sp. NBU794 TaxID=3422590 RepID=UPI003D6DF7F4
MTEYLSKELANPESVKRLRLHCADLTELPDELSWLTNLEYLELSFNNFEALPSVVCKLRQLKKLHIRHNKLRHLNDELGELQNLKMIHMPNNADIDSATVFIQLAKIPNLERLSLGNCGIHKIDASIGDFTQLKVLNLYGNQIADLPCEMFGLKKLQFLNLQGNPIDISNYRNKFASKSLTIVC